MVAVWRAQLSRSRGGVRPICQGRDDASDGSGRRAGEAWVTVRLGRTDANDDKRKENRTVRATAAIEAIEATVAEVRSRGTAGWIWRRAKGYTQRNLGRIQIRSILAITCSRSAVLEGWSCGFARASDPSLDQDDVQRVSVRDAWSIGVDGEGGHAVGGYGVALWWELWLGRARPGWRRLAPPGTRQCVPM